MGDAEHSPGMPLQAGLVADLSRVNAGMLPAVGGKAVNLGVLIAAGFPVPPGFCLTTQAYRRMEAAAGMGDVLAGIDIVAHDDREQLAAYASRARRVLLAAAVPEQITAAVREAYDALGTGCEVAVRSSATAEDLPAASFAGQQETFLNVGSFEGLMEAVRHCWASLWTDRAVVYRSVHSIEQRSVGTAVVIQKMVSSAAAGVLFTANPLTGRRKEAVIDASTGLGEAVVSGAVNPDHFVVDSATRRISSRQIAGDRPGEARNASITDAQVLDIAALGAEAEERFGAPQDVEWAIDADGVLWVTQSRAITTLFPLPATAYSGQDLRVYVCASLLQGLTRPLTPMGMAAYQKIASSTYGIAAFGGADGSRESVPYLDIGGRLFTDMTPIVRTSGGRRLILRAFKLADARTAAALAALGDDPRFAPVKRPRRVAARGLGNLVKTLQPGRVLQLAVNPSAAQRLASRAGDRLSRALAFTGPATPLQRLDYAERVLTTVIVPGIWGMLPPMEAGFACLGIARLLLKGSLQPGELETVMRGLPHNVTTEMDLELWRISTLIRDDPSSAQTVRRMQPEELARRFTDNSLPPVAQTVLHEFLQRYGHRAVAEIDLGMPRWSEDPTHLIGVIANYLRLSDPELAPDRQFLRAASRAEAKAAELVSRASARGRLRGEAVRFALDRTRRLAGMRELPKFHLVVALAAVRRQLGLVGSGLAKAGTVADADDIFFLDFEEARVGLRGANLMDLVARRRSEYTQELRRRHIPRVLLSDGTDLEAAVTTTAGPPGALLGSPASAGRVTGRARVVFDPVGAHLEPGEILVVPSADPGWTPLFLTAGGLIMEMGGAVSHAAVIAREYGIPAVVGVPDATSRITSGQLLTLDGAAGTVQLDHAVDRGPAPSENRVATGNEGPGESLRKSI